MTNFGNLTMKKHPKKKKDDFELETTMETIDSSDKEKKRGRPEMSASEILIKYRSKILNKDEDGEEEECPG